MRKEVAFQDLLQSTCPRFEIFFIEPVGIEINGELFCQLPCRIQKSYRRKHFELAGMPFETVEEVLMASLLITMRIRFMHHIRFPIADTAICPDFTLEKMFKWDTNPGDPHHGKIFLNIEVKRTSDAIQRHSRKYTLLEAVHGVPTLLLSAAEITQFLQAGALPIVALQAA